VVITRALAADLQARFGASIDRRTVPEAGKSLFTVIAPDGVDLERYACLPDPTQARRLISKSDRIPAGQRLLLQPGRFIAGYTGHLYPGRGVQLLLDLAGRLPEMSFLIVGGEPTDVARLRSQAEASRLVNILLTGFVPNADLPLYQAACDVLLMPYQQRVQASSGGDIARYLSPMKLFEYLACQRPILSSDLPVLQEVLNSQNAVLLPGDDPAAWAAALHNLRSSPELCRRLAEGARQDADAYTWEGRARRILDGLAETPDLSQFPPAIDSQPGAE
jgi:glycosyltransferase involved in cell wall biosynthesis